MPRQLEPVSLSADLLYAVKTEGETERLQRQLATLDPDQLARTVSSQQARLSFWLNCYNAYAQLLLEDESVLEDGRVGRWQFFARDRVPVAGSWVSLDDIEHGMLRRSKHPWGFGYLPRPFPSSFERRFRLEEVDPRIHFALSCGAESCPPVTVYSGEECDEELDIATEWYVVENVSFDPETNVATVPRVFLWYRGDFGGKDGVRSFLRRYGAIPGTEDETGDREWSDGTPAGHEATDPDSLTLEYDEYDWSVDVGDFRSK